MKDGTEGENSWILQLRAGRFGFSRIGPSTVCANPGCGVDVQSPGVKMMLCSNCKQEGVWYHSRECQKAHWSELYSKLQLLDTMLIRLPEEHKPTCKLISEGWNCPPRPPRHPHY